MKTKSILNRLQFACGILALTAVLAPPLSAQIVQNGSFEEGSGFADTQEFPHLDQNTFYAGHVFHWTANNSVFWAIESGEEGRQIYNTADLAAFDNSDGWGRASHFAVGAVGGVFTEEPNIFGNNAGVLSQTLTLDFRQIYDLSFIYAAGALYQGGELEGSLLGVPTEAMGWNVYLQDGYGGTVLLNNVFTYNLADSTPLVPDADWATGTAQFNVSEYGLQDTGTYNLIFEAAAKDGKAEGYSFLDNVQVAPVPEPSGAVLLGVCGLFSILRRRRPCRI